MIRTKVKAALEDLMSVGRGTLTDSDTRDTVAAWTSLVDVQITVMLAGDYGIEPDGALLEAETVGGLLDLVEQRHG